MPNPIEPPTSAALDVVVTAIDVSQAASTPFWQGAKTRTDDTVKVTDQKSWQEKGITLGAIDEDIAVHTYTGPRGDGYIIITEKPVTGGRYTKVVVNGPEQERAHDWTFSYEEYKPIEPAIEPVVIEIQPVAPEPMIDPATGKMIDPATGKSITTS